MDRLQSFMAGRSGADHFFRFQAASALVLYLLSLLAHIRILRLLAWALLLTGLYRALSRNLAARSRENAVYLARREQALRWLNLQKCRWRDRRTHCYFACPKCGKTLRVPKNQGRIVVTCAACGWQFERRT